MKRVHRDLSRDEVEALRDQLELRVPPQQADIPEILRTLRLITRKSQIEYAQFCDVAPRVLADLERGKGNPSLKSLEKLLQPFGLKVGVVNKTEADAG